MTFVAEAALLIGGSAGLSLVAKMTFALLATFAISRLWVRAPAATRHGIFIAAFGVLLILPVAAAFAPVVPIEIGITSSAATAQMSMAMTTTALPVNRPPEVVSQLPASGSPVPSFSDLLGILWFLGVVIFLVPVGAGSWELRRLRRSGVPWPDARGLADSLADEAGIRRVDVLLHASAAGPMTFGLYRPAVIFPVDAHTWDTDSLRRALLHELEHVRRYDWMTQFAARVICAAYWFHPLAWMAACELALEAERACDDAVIRREDAIEYAALLVSVAQRQRDVRRPLLAMSARGDLPARVKAVLDGTQRRGPAGLPHTLTTVAVAAAVLLTLSPLRAVGVTESSEDQQATANVARTFEVASVRPNRSDDPPNVDFTPGRFTATNVTLQELVKIAYPADQLRNDEQLQDGPDWIGSARFDVIATGAPTAEGVGPVPGAVAPPESAAVDQVRAMLRNLLVERFKLAVHHESRQLPVYALTRTRADRLGPRLRQSSCSAETASPDASSPACGGFRLGSGQLQGRGVTIRMLVSLLSNLPALGRPVADRTGLGGTFDIDVSWSPQSAPSAADDVSAPQGPAVFTAFQEQLGLRLEAVRGPVDVLVIDNAEQPMPN